MTGSRIISTGHFQPERVLTNDELTTIVDTSDEWILSRVGIRERRIADPGTGVTEMATQAGAMALSRAQIEPDDVDLVVVATCTAWDRSPNVASQVAHALGVPGPATLDVGVACAGFTHALAVADQAVRTKSATRALVVGVEKLSDVTDWTDRSTCILVGDGAGAVVVEASPSPGISPVVWGSVPSMGSAVRIGGREPKFRQDGQSVFRWTTGTLPGIARMICERAGLAPTDLSGLVLHQANRRIIVPVARALGVRENAVVATDVELSGNTSAASIPLAFSKLVVDGSISSGDPVLFLGFGGGLSYAGQVVHTP
ncbi:MAG: beta-ketoacyl-ACP synthase III [Angustibacter sp.]